MGELSSNEEFKENINEGKERLLKQIEDLKRIVEEKEINLLTLNNENNNIKNSISKLIEAKENLAIYKNVPKISLIGQVDGNVNLWDFLATLVLPLITSPFLLSSIDIISRVLLFSLNVLLILTPFKIQYDYNKNHRNSIISKYGTLEEIEEQLNEKEIQLFNIKNKTSVEQEKINNLKNNIIKCKTVFGQLDYIEFYFEERSLIDLFNQSTPLEIGSVDFDQKINGMKTKIKSKISMLQEIIDYSKNNKNGKSEDIEKILESYEEHFDEMTSLEIARNRIIYSDKSYLEENNQMSTLDEQSPTRK